MRQHASYCMVCIARIRPVQLTGYTITSEVCERCGRRCDLAMVRLRDEGGKA